MTAVEIRRGPGGLVDVGVPSSPVALELPAGLDFEDWKQVGAPLLEASHSLMWWVGDWLNYGEVEYGQTYALAMKSTGMDQGTLANAKWVCGKVDVRVRRADLSFSHHQAVASLSRSDQIRFLKSAAAKEWTVDSLRSEVRAWQSETARAAAKPAPTPAVDGSGGSVKKLHDGREDRREDAGQRTCIEIRLSAAPKDSKAVGDAVERVVTGLRAWLAGEGLDATIEVTR